MTTENDPAVANKALPSTAELKSFDRILDFFRTKFPGSNINTYVVARQESEAQNGAYGGATEELTLTLRQMTAAAVSAELVDELLAQLPEEIAGKLRFAVLALVASAFETGRSLPRESSMLSQFEHKKRSRVAGSKSGKSRSCHSAEALKVAQDFRGAHPNILTKELAHKVADRVNGSSAETLKKLVRKWEAAGDLPRKRK